jgi:inorganic pyrophosphatase/exopolyphosphatase
MIGVIGNEANDADSIVCAIAYAHFRNGIPFVNFSLSDLNSRLDFMAICDIVNIENPLERFRLRSRHESDVHDITEWILVDHHVNHFVSPIVEIIDHHQLGSTDLSHIVHTIEFVGSCSTLVAEKLLTSITFCKSDIGQDMLRMLLLTIVLDTLNFSQSAHKSTEKDIRIAKQICEILSIDDNMFPAWFERMRIAKFDPRFWYAIENREKILWHDFKEFLARNNDCVGISTILRHIDDSVIDTVIRVKGQWKLFVVGAGYMRDGKLQSELLIVGKVGADIVANLVSQFQLESCCLAQPRSDVLLFRVFDVTFSRKRFAPVLLRLLDSE